MLTLRDRGKQFGELSRLFFRRFLENDLICIDGDTRGTLVGIISLLVSPGAFLPLLEYLQFSSYPLGFLPWYVRDQAALPDKVLHIALSMTVLGLFTVFEWDAVLPDRRDIAVLRPFPVGLGTLFAAKIAALGAFWLVFTVAVDGISGWFFPVAVIQNAPLEILLWYIRCHGLALLAANAFMFLALIAIQGLLMTVLGWKRYRRVAPYAQFVLFVVILSLFFLSIGLAFGVNTGAPPSALINVLPAWWFVGFDQIRLGWHSPFFAQLHGHVGWALGLAASLAAAAYALSYRRCVSRAFEEQDGPVAVPGCISGWLTAAVNRVLVRRPSERASFYFVWHTVTRSRTHRLLVAAWAGAGVALVFQGITGAIASGDRLWWQTPAGPLLPVPIVVPLFLVTGMRYAFTVPSELRANWLFQTAGNNAPAEYLAGARKAALLLALAPLFSLVAPVYIALWGWVTGGLHVLFGAILGWLLLEAQLAGLEKVPFTCSYVPGKANLKTCWTFYVMAYLAYVAAMSWLNLKLLEAPHLFPWFVAAAGLARFGIERYRNRHEAFTMPLLFDERPEPAVQTLELQQ